MATTLTIEVIPPDLRQDMLVYIVIKNNPALFDQIFSLTNSIFNLASPKQLGEVLFDKLKIIDSPKKTKSGQYSTSEEILSKLAKDHEVVSEVLKWRSLQKLINTYVDALPKQINLNFPVSNKPSIMYLV